MAFHLTDWSDCIDQELKLKFRKNRDSQETDGIKRYGFIAQDILEIEGDNPVIIDAEQEDNLKYKQSIYKSV